jgi:hypothetical protein
MRRTLIATALVGAVIALLLFAACGGDDNDNAAEPDGEQTTEQTDPATQDEILLVDGEQYPILESCVDNSGQYTGNLADGGIFILRGGNGPDESFVDFLPSEDADPLSSEEPEDTIVASEGSFVTGTSTVYTEDGANSLELEFGIIIEDTEEGC